MGIQIDFFERKNLSYIYEKRVFLKSIPSEGTHFEPRFRGSVRMRGGPEDTKSGKDNGPWRVSTNSALAVEKENRQNRWKVVGFWPLNQLFGFFFF